EGERSVGSRVALGGEGCRARFRRIRVPRDHFYLPLGEHGLDRPVELGPDEFFLLGDNSFDSFDSRFFGPVTREQILGRPVWVVWPPGRIRRLGGGLVSASGTTR
ncbi:MAG: S26 family signal peptidase, partial [Planctomycetota bacterium]|nr:S26 family signal peptidase [Planctomycetota bacterium]